ncbi:MAG TPA: glycosyltransferase [Caulobacteraceae bacterium]|nr:glycosyltransferase [Caulobacteraceae bacterium]
MISVVIATQNQERLMGPVLSALVAGAVDGVVRQVIIADGGSTDATLEIAKDSGADVLELSGPVESRLAAGCGKAKSDWLLILDPSVVPPPGWEAAAREHIEQGADRAAWFAPTRGGLFGGPPKVHGLLVSRRQLNEAGGYSAGLVRRLGGRLSRLKPAKELR